MSAINLKDARAGEYIKKMVRMYPAVWTGFGEIIFKKQEVSEKIAGGPPSLYSPSLDAIFDVIGEMGAVAVVHCDHDTPYNLALQSDSAANAMIFHGKKPTPQYMYFAANTLPVATIISLTEHKSLRRIWADCYFWSFPYYLVGAGVAGLVSWLNRIVEWQTSLLILPAVYLIYRSYRLYLAKLEDEKGHVEEMANLHMIIISPPSIRAAIAVLRAM